MSTRILGLVCALVAFGTPSTGEAKPSWAASLGLTVNSCRDGCHVNVQSDRMAVIDGDKILDLGTQLSGQTRGPLQTFVAMPGETVTLSMQVLDGSDQFAVQLKRLEAPGQRDSLANFLVWAEDNLAGNPWTPQEIGTPPNPIYFTKDNGSNGGLNAMSAGVFTFDLFIDPATPPDVYDLEFATAGLLDEFPDSPWYQDKHFYVEVVPEPGRTALALGAALPLFGLAWVRRSARRAGCERA